MGNKRGVVDPEVARRKFQAELGAYREVEDSYIARGWWLVKAEFPRLLIVLGVPQLSPPAVLFGLSIDFTDYDYSPPSVVMVNPFTQKPYRLREVPSVLNRTVPAKLPPQLAMFGGLNPGGQMMQQQPLVVGFGPDEIPFLCIPGTYEYHSNPGHSGDPWFLHRKGTEGTLFHILNTFFQYGVAPITDYIVQPVVKGFSQDEVPQ